MPRAPGPASRPMDFFIVSGLSGSGKTVALQALEDLGYYCIDNLPADLLPHFTGALRDKGGQGSRRAAVSIDARNRGFLENLADSLQALEAQGLEPRILFLEADDATLFKRFSETRRRHPLTDAATPLAEAIRQERRLLAPLAARATRQIDTSATTPHELRARVRDIAGGLGAQGVSLLFQSFGYKHGAPLDADFVFDVRCLPNPYWEEALRARSGRDPEVADFLRSHAEVNQMIDEIAAFLERWLPAFDAEDRSYITVGIGCTGGQHRSVYVADRLAEHFARRRLDVHVRHRELT